MIKWPKQRTMTISPRTYAGSFRKEASSLVGMWRTGHEVGIAGSHLATVGETLRLKVVQWALMLRDWDKSIPKDIIWAPGFSHAWASHYRACRLFSSLSPQRTFIVKASLNQVSVICDKEPCLKVNKVTFQAHSSALGASILSVQKTLES